MVEHTCSAMAVRVWGLTVHSGRFVAWFSLLPPLLPGCPSLPAFLHWASLLDHCLLYCTLPINSKGCWISFLDQSMCLILMPPKTFLDLLPSSCSTHTAYTMNCQHFHHDHICVICEWGTLVQYLQVAERIPLVKEYEEIFIKGSQEYWSWYEKLSMGKTKCYKCLHCLVQ